MKNKIVQFPREQRLVMVSSANWIRAAAGDYAEPLEEAAVVWLGFWGVLATMICVYQLSLLPV